jgi:hypothetical protein
VVVTSKIVSKAEGRFLKLGTLEPSERARELAQITRKDVRASAVSLKPAPVGAQCKGAVNPHPTGPRDRHDAKIANGGRITTPW